MLGRVLASRWRERESVLTKRVLDGGGHEVLQVGNSGREFFFLLRTRELRAGLPRPFYLNCDPKV